jgi:hypothetical protein
LGDANVDRLGVHDYEKPPDILCDVRGLTGYFLRRNPPSKITPKAE